MWWLVILVSYYKRGSLLSLRQQVESPINSTPFSSLTFYYKWALGCYSSVGTTSHISMTTWHQAIHATCYVLGLTQGAFFIFHLLTKPFPSRDQPPIHLDHHLLTKPFPSRDQPPIHLNHMTNNLTSHLTTHMTSHMPSQSPAPQSHLSYITCSQVTCASPDTPSPDLTWPYLYPWLISIRLTQLRFRILGPLTILSS